MNKQRFLNETEPENINHFELRFNLIKIRGENTLVAKPQILVDGEPIKEELPVDLRDLVASLKKPGAAFIYTCGCGYAECASVEEGILVSHQPQHIQWEYRLPQSSDGFGVNAVTLAILEDSELPDGVEIESAKRYKNWLENSTPYKHVFDRQQMIESIYLALLDAEGSHPEDTSYPPQGFERHHISQLLAEVKALRK